MKFETKDSGERQALANGMVRDTEAGKIDYTLITTGPMFDRWAELLARGAAKYGPNNWEKATRSTDRAEREETKARFARSAFRHFRQWQRGDTDEDHAAAVFFNLNGYEAMLLTDHLAEEDAPQVGSRSAEITFGKNQLPGEMVPGLMNYYNGLKAAAAPQNFVGTLVVGGVAADLTPGESDLAADTFTAASRACDADGCGVCADRLAKAGA